MSDYFCLTCGCISPSCICPQGHRDGFAGGPQPEWENRIDALRAEIAAKDAEIIRLKGAAEFFMRYSHHEWKCFKYRHPHSDATCTCEYDKCKAVLKELKV